MRAQWICSRERRIALYKWSSINPKKTTPDHVTAASNLGARGTFLLTGLWFVGAMPTPSAEKSDTTLPPPAPTPIHPQTQPPIHQRNHPRKKKDLGRGCATSLCPLKTHEQQDNVVVLICFCPFTRTRQATAKTLISCSSVTKTAQAQHHPWSIPKSRPLCQMSMQFDLPGPAIVNKSEGKCPRNWHSSASVTLT